MKNQNILRLCYFMIVGQKLMFEGHRDEYTVTSVNVRTEEVVLHNLEFNEDSNPFHISELDGLIPVYKSSENVIDTIVESYPLVVKNVISEHYTVRNHVKKLSNQIPLVKNAVPKYLTLSEIDSSVGDSPICNVGGYTGTFKSTILTIKFKNTSGYVRLMAGEIKRGIFNSLGAEDCREVDYDNDNTFNKIRVYVGIHTNYTVIKLFIVHETKDTLERIG